MRIGIDGRLWNETGVGRYIRNLVWELQKLDTKNDYVLFIQSKRLNKQPFDVAQGNKRWKVVETDIHWHSFAEQLQFPQILYKENLDLMHFPYFSHPIFYNKPFVVTIHDLIINHFPTGKASTLPFPFYYIKRVGYDFALQHAVKRSQKIIVPLNAVKEDLEQTLKVSPSKIVVTEEGVDLHESKSGKKELEIKGEYFLYVGNAYPHKNLNRIVEAFVLFRREKSEAQLVLVGKDDYFYKQLEEKVARENLEGIVFQHDVSDESLFTLYANAKAFISASFMEGFGLPPLEAMSASCPVILSDIPSFREVCGKSAFYFNPNDPYALKEKMSIVYNLSQKEKNTYVLQGHSRVKDFSWKKMAEETKQAYESSISIR